MRILEFGQANKKKLLLFHASCMTWEFLKSSIELLSEQFHIIVPVLPGYDMEDDGDYTSVEEIAKETEVYLLDKGWTEIEGIYGISMGGSIVIRMLANENIRIGKAIIDAGITPVQLPKFLANLIVLRDYSFMMTLKNSLKFMTMFIPEKKYGTKMFDKLRKVMLHATRRTIWNNFKSCNTYSMPESICASQTQIQYWYGNKEKYNRNRDIKYVKKIFPQIEIVEIAGYNHAEFIMLEPDTFARKLTEFIDSNTTV